MSTFELISQRKCCSKPRPVLSVPILHLDCIEWRIACLSCFQAASSFRF